MNNIVGEWVEQRSVFPNGFFGPLEEAFATAARVYLR